MLNLHNNNNNNRLYFHRDRVRKTRFSGNKITITKTYIKSVGVPFKVWTSIERFGPLLNRWDKHLKC